MKREVYITVFLMCFGFARAQQQTLYTNYLLNQYLYNPAYAGVVEGNQFSIGYRNQWVGFDGAPKTYLVSGFGNLKKKPKMAIGGIISTERIGLLQRTAFYGTYSYHLKINKKASINFGLGLGGVQHKVRVYDAKPYDKDDNFMGSDVINGLAFDANAGFYFYTKNFFLGFSDQHMTNSKIRWDNTNGKNTTHFYAYTGYNFAVDSKKEWVIQPSILARTNSPAPYQLEYNAKVIYQEMVWLGISFRQKSSLCFLVGCKINKEFVFGYSYDYTLNKLQNYSSGSHEIMISYLMPFKKKKSKSELIKDADEEELNKIDNTLKTNLRSKKKKEKEKPKESENEPAKTTEPATNPETVNPPATETLVPESTNPVAPETTEKISEPETKKSEEPATTNPNQQLKATEAEPKTELPVEPNKEAGTEPKK